jgi:hypothetical protein
VSVDGKIITDQANEDVDEWTNVDNDLEVLMSQDVLERFEDDFYDDCDPVNVQCIETKDTNVEYKTFLEVMVRGGFNKEVCLGIVDNVS